jgi:hypothetical protein
LADGGGDADFEGPVGGLGVECGIGGGDDGVEDEELAGAIDVALDDVAAERAAGGGGELEVEECAGCKRAEGGLVEGFLGEVGVEESGVNVERGEAYARDAEGIAFAEATGEAGGFDGDAADAAAVEEADESPGLLDDAGEHSLILVDSGQGTVGSGQWTGNREGVKK